MNSSCQIPKKLLLVRGLFALSLAAFCLIGAARMAAQSSTVSPKAATQPPSAVSAGPQRMRGTTNAQRKAAAAHLAARRAASVTTRPLFKSNAVVGIPGSAAGPASLDQLYFSGLYPNYANSPAPNLTDTTNCPPPSFCGIRKFVDTLPLPGQTSDLGNTFPVAVPDTTTFPGSDYYEISLVQYRQQLHTDLPAVSGTWPNQTGGTLLRGYVQTNAPAGSPSLIPYYLGPIIIAQSNRPVRVKFTNALPTGPAGNLFIPVDLSALGAGLGLANGNSPYLQNRATIHMHGGNTPWISDGTPHQWTIPAGDWNNTLYQRGASVQFVPDMFFVSGQVVPQCSATVTTNCSDPTGANNAATLPPNATNDPGNGSLTFYYTNQQSQRLLFYHDHAYGITRLNVYAGEASAMVIRDDAELDMINGTNVSGVFTQAGITPAPSIPSAEIPLVIQDKTFVPQNPGSTTLNTIELLDNGSGYTTATVTFSGGCATEPVVTPVIGTMMDPYGQYITGAITSITVNTPGQGCAADPVVTITGDGSGAVAFASIATLSQEDPTWDSAAWGGYGNFWYPHVYMTNQWPGNPDGSGTNPMGRWDYASWFWPPFNGNPGQYTVRGELPCPVPYDPTMTCPGVPSALAPAPTLELDGSTHLGVGSTVSLTPEGFMDTPVVNGVAYPTLTVDPKPYRFRILSIANERSFNLSWFIACGTGGYTATVGATCPTPVAGTGIAAGTEVGMVPSVATAGFPIQWPSDGRAGGVPDPAGMGPSWIQIGTEGGVLPAPAVIPPTPINYEQNMRSVTVTNIQNHGLLLMSAERADAIVDFTPYAGKTLILYNDAPAPAPAHDDRNDYYTGDPDQVGTGGAPSTIPGFGPNTRTIMQVIVNPSVTGAAQPAVNMANLNKLIPAAFNLTQPVPIIPEPAYGAAYGQTFKATYPALQSYNLTFTPIDPVTKKLSTAVTNIPAPGGTAVTLDLRFKTIQELFDLDYGRMNATLGTELPLTNYNTQTTIPLGYVDPFTEDIYDSANVAAKPVGTTGDGTQLWIIVHNGVDSHAIHFHLYDVQLINRYGWDGTNRIPFPDELGWKDTVRMNPLEIDFVALRPISQTLPFPVPDSQRLFDVTKPAGSPDLSMTNIDPAGNAAPRKNQLQPMGWEYVWHCHLLGHEENDMMREQVFQVPPETPVAVSASVGGSGAAVTFTDMSLSETGFTVQRADDSAFTTNVQTFDVPGAHQGWNTPVTYNDQTAVAGNTYYYRVQAYKPDADYWQAVLSSGPLGNNTWPNLVSAWSAIAQTGIAPAATITPTTPVSFGTQLVGTTSAPVTVTITNSGAGLLVVGGITFAGSNPGDFNQINTCTSPLAGGSSCSISITFTPTALGARVGNLSFTTSDPSNPLLNVALSGTGISPVMVLSPPALNFGNQPIGTTSAAPQVVTISNSTGTAPLSISSIGITGANAGDFSMTQTCGAAFPVVLGVGASCTASISFAPTAAGARAAALSVGAAQPAANQAVALSGTGTVPSAVLTPGSLAFANQLVNTASTAQTVTLSNTGLAPLAITSITFGGTNPADFSQTNTCGTSLAAGASCPILVTFKPLARLARSATLVVTDNSSTLTQTATLTGTGIAPVAAIFPVSVPFGVQVIATTSAPQTLVVSNSGDAPLVINNVSIGGANASDFSVSLGSCTAAIPAPSVCSLTVSFTPTASGPRTGLLSLASSDPVNPLLTVPLTGTGTAVALSPAAISFPNQTVNTSSISWTVTIGNAGPTTLTINSIAVSGTNASDFVLNNQCAGTIASGRSCTVRVRFAPTAIGMRTASLVVGTSDLGTPQASVALSGTGVAPALSVSPASLTFSSPVNTASVAQTVTVSNVGTAPLTITGITLNGVNTGQFTQTNNCAIGTPIAVGAGCTVNVTFRPTSTNPIAKSQTLNINVAAPAVSQSITLTGNVVVPTYSVSPAAITFPNQAINTTSAVQTVTVTNTGTVPLPISNINLGGANANRFAQTNTCGMAGFRPFPSTLAVGASCTISTTFRPTTATTSTASLNVSVGGGATPAQTAVPLTGTGQ